MKFALDWHRQCLANMRKNLERSEAELIRLQNDVDRSRKEIEHAAAQIAEAERRGLDEYDREKFLKRDKKRSGVAPR